MVNCKENKGITLIALVITIILIIILAGISLTYGTGLLENAEVETYITNMVTIKSKAKVYAEEIHAKTWDINKESLSEKKNELYLDNYHMITPSNADFIIEKINDSENNYDCYEVTADTLDLMGLGELKEEQYDNDYVVVYNQQDYTKLDVVYKQGIEYKDNIYYTLSSLQNVVEPY